MYGIGKDGARVATAVVAGLVSAYAELRQLEFLLESLLNALLEHQPQAAAHVLCTSAFTNALHKVSFPPCATQSNRQDRQLSLVCSI